MSVTISGTTGVATPGVQNSADETIAGTLTVTGAATAGVIKSTSTTAPTTFQNSAGTEIGTLCRAWVNFNGATGAIRNNFNVTSVTRNATGSYTINFTTAMPDVNYSTVAAINLTAISGYYATPTLTGLNTANTSITIFYGGISNAVDPSTVCVSVFR